MRITRIYVRFYKSFNYDYERKFAPNSNPDPWEMLGDAWYPYVRLELEASITTIVGANESGKSHLLDSVEKLITGRNIDRSDFCRYSQFFSVEIGQRRFPDFGGEFEAVTEDDVDLAKEQLGIDLEIGSKFHLFRANDSAPAIYMSGVEVPGTKPTKHTDLSQALSGVFRLDAKVPLPASIPLYELTSEARRPSGSRRTRGDVLNHLYGRSWSSPDEFTQSAADFFGLAFQKIQNSTPHDQTEKQYALGRDLLFKVARIDPTVFEDLSDAIADEREGYVNGIIQKINQALAAQLNFPRWWAQDREFKLMVSPREYDLVFTIRDRTGTDYSFAERSNGLRYFLSYHVQLLAHQRPSTVQQEILLMDEPDAYLSSQGQQDLLRILEEFAVPEDGSRRDQVAYVTHSPFLINRNAGERIRVLDKGLTDEGTRVVKDVARNHYEPLRSSLGAFVAETSFISGSNLFVEGLADQVLIAGASSHLQAKGVAKIDTLDLNNVTIVPAGSASSIPYLIYLARGRDVVRPPCVALLDGDQAGRDAAKALARGGARQKQVLPANFIVEIGTWAKDRHLSLSDGVSATEIEDLLSLPLAVKAAQNYAVRVLQISRKDAASFTAEDVSEKLPEHEGSLFDALKNAFTQRLGSEFHIEKVGFAKEVIAVLADSRSNSDSARVCTDFEGNIAALLSEIAKLLRQAARDEQDRRLNNRLDRTIAGFLADHSSPTTRERGRLLIEEIQASVHDSEEGDRIRLQTERIRRDFDLDENLGDPIERFDDFREKVAALRYEERFAKQNAQVVEVNPPIESRSTADPLSGKGSQESQGEDISTPQANA
ncbi:AAA family ATPase [Streptomyces sp. NPDC058685]|uniref:AAA family ATPase n=1 Tax=Streptomyces sp. NPDC058685 TaxID=3346598 RepID=UPI00364BC422